MTHDKFNAEHSAVYWCQNAATSFAMAWAGQMDAFALNGFECFEKAADKLGYDLVKRQTPAQEHDAAIAARRAEDGPEPITSKPGFDGRQRLEDMEWSR